MQDQWGINMKKIISFLFIFTISMCVTSCSRDANTNKTNSDTVVVTSVSSDGKYAITTHENKHAYLWNLNKHTYKLITKKNINIYNVHFIPNTEKFIYQVDKTNEVIIQSINGKVLKKITTDSELPSKYNTANYSNSISTDSPDKSYQLTSSVGSMMVNKIDESGEMTPFFIMSDKTMPGVKKYYQNNYTHGLVGLKFIDNTHFIAMFQGSPMPLRQLGLYDINNMKKSPEFWTEYYLSPNKYLPLTRYYSALDLPSGHSTQPPSTLAHQLSMDTSPSAHVLVMGQKNTGGIMVYKYNPQSQELILDWSGKLSS